MKITKQILLIVVLIVTCHSASKAQSLDSLYQMAVEHNTTLKAIASEYEAILTKEDQVSQLPNPQIGVGVPVLRPETRLGPQVMMISASQMFPWFGTFDSKKAVILEMSKAKYEEISAVKLDLFYQIKSAYYQLVFLDQKRALYERSLENYTLMESTALAKVEAGEASIADVLRIQAKIDEYQSLIQQLENDKLSFAAQINQVTHRPLDQEIVTRETIGISLDNYDLDAFKSKISNHHPLIAKLDHQIEVSKNKVNVNQKMNQPTIGVGLDYGMINLRTDADPMNNGRDILTPKLMVSIPLYRKGYHAVNQEEELTQTALTFKKESLTDDMLSKIISYKSDYDNAALTLELIKKQEQKLESAYEVLVASYSADGKKIEELLTIQNELILLKLKAYQSELIMGLAVAKIERLTNY
ncbi:TolC family protein [Parvicella tangerina]|uniref:TolC family protein n=1 Tax=Parvicella tangerina TaxID=2829795 RepID=A0A916JMM6_9FLAO|nr:TolC family protein [Parvicella tangerina]CAG5082069.1 hypothetical protein CRYO30217_01799 [Parvicella tangerina]